MGDVVHLVPFIPRSVEAFAFVKTLSTEQLKRAWDRWDSDADPGCWIIEAIHAEMNSRGEGVYVAV